MTVAVNKAGADWQNLRVLIDEKIRVSRDNLEGFLSMEMVHYERGQIAALRSLIREVEGDGTPAIKEENYGF